MENENELNPLDAFADEEISEVSTKKFEQVPNNTFKRDGILTERIVVNGKRTNVVVIQDLENGGVWTASPTYRVVPHNRLLKTVNTLADEIGIELETAPEIVTEENLAPVTTKKKTETLTKVQSEPKKESSEEKK